MVKSTSSTRCEDFVEAAGAWWAGRIETFDAEGRRTSRTVQQFKPLSTEAMDQQIAQELTGRDQIQFLHEPLPKLTAAKQAIASGKATFDDQVVLLLHFARSQQWTRAMEYLEQAEKAGRRQTRSALDSQRFLKRQPPPGGIETTHSCPSRHNWPMRPAARQSDSTDDLFLANHLLGQSSGILEANEMLALLDALKPVFERQPQYLARAEAVEPAASELFAADRPVGRMARPAKSNWPRNIRTTPTCSSNTPKIWPIRATTNRPTPGLPGHWQSRAHARPGPMAAKRRRIAAELLFPIARAGGPISGVGRLFGRLDEAKSAGHVALSAIS